jgi:hypothetical protein
MASAIQLLIQHAGGIVRLSHRVVIVRFRKKGKKKFLLMEHIELPETKSPSCVDRSACINTSSSLYICKSNSLSIHDLTLISRRDSMCVSFDTAVFVIFYRISLPYSYVYRCFHGELSLALLGGEYFAENFFSNSLNSIISLE